jgi:two-component system, LytTR family, response regulator
MALTQRLTSRIQISYLPKNLGEYELVLPLYFYRYHHSFMINLNQIKKFEKARSGLLEMNWDCKVPVSQHKMKEFSELLDKDN